ncbi:uncharacterized protein C10orf88 homolog isoform X2 [Rhinatrema bivittatum]|nr:uncharacterized protein C10orf88 homolog isoform X2 [Rhinatrema bivittatum]
MEIYAKEEEYVGTSRGEVYLAASDSGNGTVTFYRKFLKMESPTPACKVKLLSHGGKERLLLRNITVELTASTAQCPRSFPPLGTSIDLGRVQTMMDCMGCKLSPGAQQLLSMVQHQQKQNLFPLGIQLQGLGCVCREGQLPGSGTAPRKGSSWTLPQADDFAALVSSVLEKQASGSSDLARTDLLPFLQNLCGQVNHMRIEERSAGHEPETRSEEHTMNLGNEQPACSYLESMVYKRLEHVEKKLLTHIDDRMDKLTEHMNDRMDRMMEHMDAQFAVLMSSLQNSHPSKLPQRQVNMGETLNRGEI